MENDKKSVDFFLGAVGPGGFRGYFEQLGAEPGIQLYLIKSGPGCGKSTMMRRIAQKAGDPVERIHCSSDPDSLDGVILPRPFAAVLDATAPHTLDPAYPGAAEEVVSLYHTMDTKRLKANRAEIIALFRRCKCLQGRAARYISSAAELLSDSRRTAAGAADMEKAHAYANRLALRYLPRRGGEGRESIRLLSAVTPQGHKVFRDTIPALADTLVVFHDEYGACSSLLMETLRRLGLERGYHVVTCPCPLSEGKIDHLFLPELRLAFLTSNSWHSMEFPDQKNIHCTRFEAKDRLRCRKKRLRFNRRAAADLLAQASAMQCEAKASHDELEAFYGAAVDFSAVDAAAAALNAKLGL